MIPQETDPELPVSVQEHLAEAWVSGGLLQGKGKGLCTGPFEGGHHYLHYLPHSQVKQQGGNRALPINRKLD